MTSVREAVSLDFLSGGLGSPGRQAVKKNCGLVNFECLFAKLCIKNLADRHCLLVVNREWLAGKKMECLLSCLESQMVGEDA